MLSSAGVSSAETPSLLDVRWWSDSAWKGSLKTEKGELLGEYDTGGTTSCVKNAPLQDGGIRPTPVFQRWGTEATIGGGGAFFMQLVVRIIWGSKLSIFYVTPGPAVHHRCNTWTSNRS